MFLGAGFPLWFIPNLAWVFPPPGNAEPQLGVFHCHGREGGIPPSWGSAFPGPTDILRLFQVLNWYAALRDVVAWLRTLVDAGQPPLAHRTWGGAKVVCSLSLPHKEGRVRLGMAYGLP